MGERLVLKGHKKKNQGHALGTRRTVFTDGSCLSNPGGDGGWAWAVAGFAFCSGYEPDTTNNRMELRAVCEALATLDDDPLILVSDSKYVVNCFNMEWHVKWAANGWLTAQKRPVSNRDLWEELVPEVQRRGSNLIFEWVRGHSNHPMNDFVDELARQAARERKGMSEFLSK